MEQKTPIAADPPAELQGIRFLGDLQRLELKPGEVLVLTVDSLLDARTAERMRHNVQRAVARPGFLPDVLVLERGMKLGVLACSER